MQSSYQYHFGTNTNPIFGGGSLWGDSGGSTGGQSGGGAFSASYIHEVGVHEVNASSVKEYAYTEDKNFRYRPAMEDTYCIKDKAGNDPSCGIFSIFDGHGGRQVADHCQERIGEELHKEILKAQQNDLSNVLEQVFLKIDNECRLIDADNTGSTACVAVTRVEKGQRVLYVANLGDTRAVISNNGTAERLSYDHRGTDPVEIDRIKSVGGIIVDGRVGGSLALTRAFGDHNQRKNGVIAKPYIKKHVLRGSDKFLIIASDGVWDSMEDHEAVKYCREESNAKEIAQAIVKGAIEKGSKDNTSCLVVRFHS
ncbi:hypothetical protein FGO68_gene6618 [Halteria grandinella]|uniref:PPM-type phosphatase domain-containing protein n=1 Tax=Halteria grandinella TaxID=5974 RepID=A0A8J8NKX9_HALGN|nr:hypothetical protein FGO68_gene6618 [Halteria grandinella]